MNTERAVLEARVDALGYVLAALITELDATGAIDGQAFGLRVMRSGLARERHDALSAGEIHRLADCLDAARHARAAMRG